MRKWKKLVDELKKRAKLYHDIANECRAENHELAYWLMRGKMEGLLEVIKILEVEADPHQQEETA